MKILHVLDHSLPEVDGYSIRSHNILLHQKKHGLDVLAVTSPKQGKVVEPVETIGGIQFYRTRYEESKGGVRALPYLKEGLLIARLYRRILEIAREEKVDLIHAHSPSLNGIPSYRVGRRLKVPVVYEMRTLWEERPETQKPTAPEVARFLISRWLETQLLLRVDAITVISQGLKNDLVNRRIEASKVGVFPNGVDIELFIPSNINERLKDKLGLAGRFVVGYVGSFKYWEGLDLLVRAMAVAVKQRPDIRLLFVGADDATELKNVVHLLQMDKFTAFAGPIVPDQILDYYSLIDLFVYPRKKIRLTELVTPLKPLEAMAMEKLVLASDVGGHKELIRHRETGLLFQADNELDLAKQISDVAADTTQYDPIRKAARRDILHARNWSDIADGYAKYYAGILRLRKKTSCNCSVPRLLI